jgi:hypothetical protein
VFAVSDFGVAVRKVSLRIARNRAAEFAIDVEADGLRGIVKEPNVGSDAACAVARRPIVSHITSNNRDLMRTSPRETDSDNDAL